MAVRDPGACACGFWCAAVEPDTPSSMEACKPAGSDAREQGHGVLWSVLGQASGP